MVPRLRALVALTEDAGSVPSTHSGLQSSIPSLSEDTAPFADLHLPQACKWHTDKHVGKIHMKTNKYILKTAQHRG